MVGYNEDGVAVPIEPFNLNREREEGFFDSDGNYVEYRLEGMTDAWLEELAEVGDSNSHPALLVYIDDMLYP